MPGEGEPEEVDRGRTPERGAPPPSAGPPSGSAAGARRPNLAAPVAAATPQRASQGRALRNLFVAGCLAIVGAVLLLSRVLDPQGTVLTVAVATGLLLVLAVVARPLPAVGPWAWAAVGLAFVLSRLTTVIATADVYVVRDADTHILGLPFIIASTGHLPGTGVTGDIDVYRSYPALHMVLAAIHLVSGLPLWEGSLVLALVLGLGTLAFIGLATRNVLPMTGVLAGAGFVVAPLAAGAHQSLQPLSVALLCLAGFAYLLSRPRSHLEQVLFAALMAFLVATHPYSTVMVGIAVGAAVLALAVWRKEFRFMVPLAIGALGAILYLALLSQDFDMFLRFLSPPSREGVGQVFQERFPQASATSVFVESWKFRLPTLLAVAGWGLAFLLRPRRALSLQVLLASLGTLYLVALIVPGAFPTRVLTITSVAMAPFIGYALLRMTPAAAAPVILACAFLAGTSVYAADQFTPWAGEGQALPQPLDKPAGVEAMADYFLTLERARLASTNPIASHPVFHDDVWLKVRGFSSLDEPGSAPREYYFYRAVSEETGFSVTRPGGDRAPYALRYPTPGNLELIAEIDRIADVGPMQLHRH